MNDRRINSRFASSILCVALGCSVGNDGVVSPSSVVTEGVSSSAPLNDPGPVPTSRVPNLAASKSDGLTDHFEVLSEEQQQSVQTYCSHLMALTAPDEPMDTKICASGMAQEVLKLEANQPNSGTLLVEQMARCAQKAQTVEGIRDCHPG